MIYKIGLMGVTGKMGLEIASLLSEDFNYRGDHYEMADAVSHSALIRSVEGVEVRKIVDDPREPVHAWIDFSRPEGTMALLERIDTPVVIGTTGFSDGEKRRIETYAERRPVLLSANTSPGMNLFFSFLRSLPGKNEMAWVGDTVLFEEHHRHKKDSPSGTAKTLLGLLKEKNFEDVQINVVRAGSNKGVHSIRWISDEEEIEIKHRVFDRKAFARGAITAAAFLIKQTSARMYSMEEVYRP